MAGCPDADTLAAMLAGELSESTRAAVATHASSCEVCHPLIEGLVDSEQTLGSDGADSGEPLELRAGARVGRYVVETRLGAGGMGVVHAAVDSELQRRVAVKLLRPERDGANARERLLREARTLARLSHPNVVTVFDVGEHRGHLFLAMELIDGGSLTAWLGRGPRTKEIVERMIEAGRGLAAAHSAGVIHRDVKPDNILVGRDGRARVTDFGLARLGTVVEAAGTPVDGLAPEALTKTGTLMGTPAYMAPEQLAARETTAHTDQWAFCATLYEALAGVRPFPAADLAARTSAIDAGRLAPGRRVPGWLRAIIARGLRADPGARWPSMDALVAALARRRRGRVIAGAIVLAALVGGFAWWSRTEPASAVLLAADIRLGCDCPLSWCIYGGCHSQCDVGNYDPGTPVPGISREGRQEALQGASRDGDTILYLSGKGCLLDRLFVARRRGAVYQPYDLTDQLDPERFAIFEGCCTLVDDGQALLIPTADRTTFLRARLEGERLVPPFEPLGELIPGSHDRRSVQAPVQTADGLTLYYVVMDRQAAVDEFGPLHGQYVVSRDQREAAFANPRRAKGVQGYGYVTGISEDGMSIFMSFLYETYVLIRPNAGDVFSAVGARFSGWRTIPVDGCQRILTTYTPGGCHQENIVFANGVIR